MKKLKPMSRFHGDVNPGDIVRIVLKPYVLTKRVDRVGYAITNCGLHKEEVCLVTDKSLLYDETRDAFRQHLGVNYDSARGYEVLRRTRR